MQTHDINHSYATILTADVLNTVLARQTHILQIFRRTQVQLSKAQSLASGMGILSLASLLRPLNGNSVLLLPADEGLSQIQENLDAAIWRALFRHSEPARLMDTDTRQTWLLQHCEHSPVPAVNRRSLTREFLLDEGRKQALLRLRAARLFSWLPRDRNSDLPVKLRKSVRVKHCLRAMQTLTTVNQAGVKQLNDLEEMFLVLDDNALPDCRVTLARNYDQFLSSRENRKTPYQDAYFVITDYMNGSIHIRFKRPDLVARLN